MLSFKRLVFTCLLVTLGLVPSLGVLAQNTMNVGFIMPQSVDPPVRKFLNTNTVLTSGSELDPAVGVELHGRGLEVAAASFGCSVTYKDITAVQIQFQYAGKVSVKTSVAQGFQIYKPWGVQTSVDRATNTWTILLYAQPGSAVLSDWDLIGGDIAQGFFAKLIASQGNKPAPVSNVRITPLNLVVNANQRSSSDVVDVTAPIILPTVSSPTIWSPNGKPVNVTLTANLSDAVLENVNNYISGVEPCSISVTAVKIDGGVQTSLGDIPFTLASTGFGTFSLSAPLSLEAARNGFNVEGRIYVFTISATDNLGNPTATSITVTVTHDQSTP